MKVLLFLLLTNLAQSILFHKDYHQNQYSDPFIKFGHFVFEKGGFFNFTIDFHWTKENSSLTCLICDDQHMNYIRSQGSGTFLSRETLQCYLPALDRCLLVKPMQKSPFQLFHSVTTPAALHFFISNCGKKPISYSLSGQFLNPSSSPGAFPHLSLTNEHLLLAYQALLVAWIFLVALLLINTFWILKANMWLHRFILVVSVAKVLSLIVEWVYWRIMASEGEVPMYLSTLNYLNITTWNVLQYTLLFLISKGWGITRLSLELSELKPALLLVLPISLLHAQRFIAEENIIPLIILFAVIGKYYIGEVHQNRTILKKQLALLEDSMFFSQRDRCQPIIEKKKTLFWRFQLLFTIVILCTFSATILSAYLLTNLNWIKFLLYESIRYFFFLGIGFIFRLTPDVLVKPPKRGSREASKIPFLVIQNPMTAEQTLCVQFGVTPEFGRFNSFADH